jgi:hypothetical protein
MSKYTYIYALVDSRDGQIRYIGKGNDPADRLASHCRVKGGTYKDRWIKTLLTAGLKPTLVLLEACLPEAWQDAERRWIKTGRALGWRLTNGTEGGEGVHPTDEVRAKLSASLKGRPKSSETRRKMSAARKGNALPETTRKKIVASSAQRAQDPAFRAKLSESHKGKIPGEDTRRKMSDATTRQWQDPEHRAKISEALKGKTRSEETCEKMRSVWQDPEYRKKMSEAFSEGKRKAKEKRLQQQQAGNS